MPMVSMVSQAGIKPMPRTLISTFKNILPLFSSALQSIFRPSLTPDRYEDRTALGVIKTGCSKNINDSTTGANQQR